MPAELGEDVRCPCRQLSPGMYSIAVGCPRHYDDRHPTHLLHCCDFSRPCGVCAENKRRGQPSGEMANALKPKVSAKAEVASFARKGS